MKRIILLCTTVLACLTGWAQETECRPMLAGNPVWVHQQRNYEVDWEKTPYSQDEIYRGSLYDKVVYKQAEESFIYTFLHGTCRLDGHDYQVVWQIDSRDIQNEVTKDLMQEVLLVREENGRVLAPYDQFFEYQEKWYAESVVIDIQGDEIVTNDYTLAAGDPYPDINTLNPTCVEQTSTMICTDNQERRTWYTESIGTIVEQIGSINPLFPLPFGPYLYPAPMEDYILNEYYCTLNSMYLDGNLVYRASEQYTHVWSFSDFYFAVYPDACSKRRLDSYDYHKPPHLQQVLDFIATLPADAIITPSADKRQETPIYDLQGRRLSSKPQKGMYIQGGKKIVNK